ncbi:MAG: hypothetical protein R2845_01280 [Thermomicrobiales bacterium]
MKKEVAAGSLSALVDRFSGDVRGEIVIVVGASGETDESQEDAESLVRSLLATGMKASAVAREAAAMTGRPRSELYALAEEIKKNEPR